LRASVAIVTYNRASSCELVLRKIGEQDTLPSEIIVVDDHSDQAFRTTTVFPRHIPFRVIRTNTELGLSACRNLCIRLTGEELIVFIDDDALPLDNWLSEIIGRFEHDDVEVLGGLCLPAYDRSPPSWWDPNILGEYLTVDNRSIVGCNLAVRRAVFDRIGGFNESLGRYGKKQLSNEETDFLLRAHDLGIKLAFEPKARVFHFVPGERMNMNYLLRRAWYQGVSTYLMVRRRLGWILEERRMRARFAKEPQVRWSLNPSAWLIYVLLHLVSLLGFLYTSVSARALLREKRKNS